MWRLVTNPSGSITPASDPVTLPFRSQTASAQLSLAPCGSLSQAPQQGSYSHTPGTGRQPVGLILGEHRIETQFIVAQSTQGHPILCHVWTRRVLPIVAAFNRKDLDPAFAWARHNTTLYPPSSRPTICAAGLQIRRVPPLAVPLMDQPVQLANASYRGSEDVDDSVGIECLTQEAHSLG